jgi:hypothetical protein
MMRAKVSLQRGGTAVWCVVAAVACAGCGTSAYEAKLDAAIKQLRLDNQFVGLDVAETLVAGIKNQQGTGAKISLRKPEYFAGQAYAEGAADPRDPSKPLSPERIKPPVLSNFPGFRFSYETFGSVLNNPTPNTSYLYFGAQPTEAGVAERIATDLQTTYPDLAPMAWTSATVTTPSGGTVQWRTLSLEKLQAFLLRAGDAEAAERNGLFQIWMYEQQGFQTFVALRTSATDEERNQLRKLVVAALGTIRVVTPAKIE